MKIHGESQLMSPRYDTSPPMKKIRRATVMSARGWRCGGPLEAPSP